MKISEFINEMDKFYPRTISAPWDTDGLQCSADPERELKRVLVALDATGAVIERALGEDYDMILTHHPMIFGSAGDIVPDRLYGGKIIKLITAGISAASFHTRLDAGEGGVNDCLAELLSLKDISTFGDDECPEIGRIGELMSPMTASELSLYIKERIGAPFVRVTGDGAVRKLAVLGGAGKDYIVPAKQVGADAILTGEVSYNTALDQAEAGIIVMEGGHYYTEQPVCHRLAQLTRDIAGAEADIFDTPSQTCF